MGMSERILFACRCESERHAGLKEMSSDLRNLENRILWTNLFGRFGLGKRTRHRTDVRGRIPIHESDWITYI